MLRNYFLVAVRNLTRNKFFSFINVFGLAISMSVCLGIIMLVADQMMYDRHNSKRNRVYRVNTQHLNPDGFAMGNDYATSPAPLTQALLKDYSGVEKAVRIKRGFGNDWMEGVEKNVNVPLSGLFADPDILDVFELELEYGNASTALSEPFCTVLTKSAARKLFREENPVGAVINVGVLGEFKVTGVIKENNYKSHIIFEALASYATVETLQARHQLFVGDEDWERFYVGYTYILLEKGRKPSEIESHLAKIASVHKAGKTPDDQQGSYRFYLQSLTGITPGPFINNAIGPFMPTLFVYFFGGLALIVMITSCFNYTNLSIAKSLNRAREIGVRKVTGANRQQIFWQFLCESVLIAVFSLGLAIFLLFLIKPFILNLQFARVLKWDLESNPAVYGVFFIFAVGVGVMAGFFPAVILSKFQPVEVLKTAGSKLKIFSRIGLRKSLLVVQFALSIVFIISVTLLYNQLALFTAADHGFVMGDKINVRLGTTPYQALKTELSTYSNIVNVAATSHIPATGITFGQTYKRNLTDTDVTNIDYFIVDESYIDNMGLTLVAGRNFDIHAGEANKNFMIINKKAAQKLMFESAHDAVGQVIYQTGDSARFEIIGVIKDYNHQALMTELAPMSLLCDPSQYSILQVKYSGTREAAIKTIEQAWAKLYPSLKVDHKDFEEEVMSFYNMVFQDFVSIVAITSFMAIAIACLGLLGMATYTTQTRAKEVSIRKVLGSSESALVVLLSKSFFKLLLVAVTVAIPVACSINNLWLQLVAYRTQITFGVILFSVAIVLVLGAVTIGSQTLRVAFSNPVAALKNE